MAALNPGMGQAVGGAIAGAAMGGGIVARAMGLPGKKKKAAAGGTATEPNSLLEGGLAAIPGFFGNPKGGAKQPTPEPVGTGGGAEEVGKPKKRKGQAPGSILTRKSGLEDATGLPPGIQTMGGTKTVLGG